MFFLATADAEGRPTCSYKGGEPGFVRVLDDHTLAFPNYDGNGMYLSMGNLIANPAVGMLFIDLERGHRMRLEGDASIDLDDPLKGAYPEAQFVVRVERGTSTRTARVHPPLPAGPAVALRAAGGLPDAGAGVEALGLGSRRAPAEDPARDPATATCSAAERTVHSQPAGSALKGPVTNVGS